MAAPERTFLTGDWSVPRNEAGFPQYREVLGGQACVRFALLDRRCCTARSKSLTSLCRS